jgi:hypothetical protein
VRSECLSHDVVHDLIAVILFGGALFWLCVYPPPRWGIKASRDLF